MEYNQKPMQVRASDQDLKGVYANAMQVVHTREEFVLDFFNLVPPQGILVARVVLSPGHAKRVLEALKENVGKYEAQFGAIQPAQAPQNELGFKP